MIIRGFLAVRIFELSRIRFYYPKEGYCFNFLRCNDPVSDTLGMTRRFELHRADGGAEYAERTRPDRPFAIAKPYQRVISFLSKEKPISH